jgi:hypothetical protein
MGELDSALAVYDDFVGPMTLQVNFTIINDS